MPAGTAAAPEEAAPAEGEGEGEAAPPEILTQDGVIGAVAASLSDSVGDLSTATFGAPFEQKLAHAGEEIAERAAAGFGGERLMQFLVFAAPGFLLFAGLLLLVWRLPFMRRWRRISERPQVRGFKLARIILPRLVLGLVPVILAAALASAYAGVFAPGWRERQMFLALLAPVFAAILARRLLHAALLALGPSRGWRLVGYAERRFLPWVSALAALAALANLLREFSVRVTIGRDVSDVAALLVDLTLAALTIAFVLRYRLAVRSLIARGRRQRTAGGTRASATVARLFEALADWWHVVALAFVGANVLARLLGLGSGSFVWESVVSVLYMGGAFVVLALVNIVFTRVAHGLGRGKPSVRRAILRRYVDIAHLLVQIAVAATTLLWVLDTWGFPLSSWLATQDGQRVVRPLSSLVLIPALIYALWTTVDTAITSALAPQDATGRSRERSARVRTLLPLLRNLVFVALIVVTVIAVLANIGIDVVPLLAGAGVIGLAFSLGAQQLVKDVIAGFFIIFEDTIAIGDRVTTGDKSGTVEGITIRTMRLRETSGAVHSIPFGQIATLRNDSRGYGVFPFSIAVSAEDKVDDAMEAVRAVGRDLWRDPDYSRRMIAPPTLFGIDALAAGSFTLSGEIRCQPLSQQGVGREFYRRLKQRFEEAGLKFA